MKNILLVTKEYPVSVRSAGIGSYTKDLAEALTNRGLNIVVLTANDNIFKSTYEKEGNVHVYKISGGDFFVGDSIIYRLINRLRSIFFYNSFRKKIANKINSLNLKYNFDLVEIPEYANLSKFWSPNKIIPTLIRFHGPSSLDRKKGVIIPKNDRHKNELHSPLLADSNSFVSEALMNVYHSYIQLESDIKTPQLHVITNCIRMKNINNFQKKHVSNNRVFKIVGAGSVGAIKGWDMLINAVARLIDDGNDISMNIYGRRADLSNYINDYKEKYHANWLLTHNHILRDDLLKEFGNADLCCFPSWFEPCGLTAIEALNCGSIVLASSFGGWQEIITDSVDGFLFDPQKGELELYKKIKQVMLLNTDQKIQILKNSKQLTENKLDYEMYIDRIMESYQKTIELTLL